jgi:preprotein translocase subunit SecE
MSLDEEDVDRRRGFAALKGAGRKAQQQRKGRFGATLDFARAVRSELRRVNWPNRDQLQQSTAVVLIIVLTLAVYVAVFDYVFDYLARLIFL